MSVPDAQRKLLEGVCAITGDEERALGEALGAVLAEPATAAVAVPPFDNSAMDGYAFHSGDLPNQDPSMPVSMRIQAGIHPEPLPPGTAARIFTGAVLPKGADTVVMQERCAENDGRVTISGDFRIGANIRRAGEDIAAGTQIVEAGQVLLPQHLGLLASAGIARVRVKRPLKVSVLATGDELVAPGTPLKPGQIYNSNAGMLAGMLKRMGCAVRCGEQVADTEAATVDAISRSARSADLVLSCGGVSVGEADFVRSAIESQGQLELWKVAVKPGKPLAFGRVGDTPILGLPGNPVSAFVTFCLFAAPVIRKMQGRNQWLPAAIPVAAAFSTTGGSREEYLRVRLRDGQLQRDAQQGSAMMSAVVRADGLARVSIHCTVSPGDRLDFFPFSCLLD